MKTKTTVKNLALLASLVFILICCSAQIASAATHSGVSGDLKWSISDGVLTITGSGDANYPHREDKDDDTRYPGPEWTQYASEVKSAKVSVTNVTDMSYWFYRLEKLRTIDFTGTNTSKVTNMEGMFSFCNYLRRLDLRAFDTSKVENMSMMFYYCMRLTDLNISSFRTSNVIDMGEMFNECEYLRELDLKNFDTSNVDYFWSMFDGCYTLKTLDLSNFTIDALGDDEVDDMLGGTYSLVKLVMPNIPYNTVELPDLSYNHRIWIYNGEEYKTCITNAGKTITYTSVSTVPPMVSISKLTTSRNHSIKVSWKKKSVLGYEVQIAGDSKFTSGEKTYTINDAAKTYKTIKNLKKGRTYYIRIRTFKQVAGKTYYGKYSAKKHIRCR